MLLGSAGGRLARLSGCALSCRATVTAVATSWLGCWDGKAGRPIETTMRLCSHRILAAEVCMWLPRAQGCFLGLASLRCWASYPLGARLERGVRSALLT